MLCVVAIEEGEGSQINWSKLSQSRSPHRSRNNSKSNCLYNDDKSVNREDRVTRSTYGTSHYTAGTTGETDRESAGVYSALVDEDFT